MTACATNSAIPGALPVMPANTASFAAELRDQPMRISSSMQAFAGEQPHDDGRPSDGGGCCSSRNAASILRKTARCSIASGERAQRILDRRHTGDEANRHLRHRTAIGQGVGRAEACRPARQDVCFAPEKPPYPGVAF
jgi:hypothetical protein